MSGISARQLKFEGREAICPTCRRGRGGGDHHRAHGLPGAAAGDASLRGGLRMNILVHTAHAQRFNRVLQRLNPDTDVRLLQVTDSRGHRDDAGRARRRGELIAIAGDRVPVSGDRVLRCPSSAARALPCGPYLIASLLAARCTCCAACTTATVYRARIDKLAERIVLPRASRSRRWRARRRLRGLARGSPQRVARSTGSTSIPSGTKRPMPSKPDPPASSSARPPARRGRRRARAPRSPRRSSAPIPAFRARIARGAEFVDRLIAEDGVVYGVSTGYGDSCTVTSRRRSCRAAAPPVHLPRLRPGPLPRRRKRRAPCSPRAWPRWRRACPASASAARADRRAAAHDILPLIPAEGSVGASGDLTPLSYVAAVLCGEREVLPGETMPAARRWRSTTSSRCSCGPKEGLAMMNGTAVMTALACLAWRRADYVSKLSARLTAYNVLASDGNAHHFDETLFSVKPHAGQQRVAARLRADLASDRPPRNEKRLQDRYSLRCAPHVIGVLEDAMPFFRDTIENELNSANDNPLIDPDQEMVLHGGHFYGGHIAFVMDSMKNLVANLADLLDRQMALLVDARYSHGLPANLSGASGERAPINHGLKALQISVSAWTAEALKLTMPGLGVLALRPSATTRTRSAWARSPRATACACSSSPSRWSAAC
jgi:histidine ammonia-lyase